MKRTLPSPAVAIAVVALVVALCGSSLAGYAAGKAEGDSIIKKLSLSGNRLKNETVTGAQVSESTLEKVPFSKRADSSAASDTATKATSADTATKATAADFASSAAPGALTPLVPGPGWIEAINASGGYQSRPLGFRKDAMGFIHLEGALSGNSSSGSTLTTLPAGARPSAYLWLSGMDGTATAEPIYVYPDGSVMLGDNDPSYISLEGLVFYPNQ